MQNLLNCKIRLLISIVFLFVSSYVNAQKEANVWWFGTYSGLDFNTIVGGYPTYIYSKPINTYEGSSTICDPTTGALIFATDGQSVWYPNGTTVSGGTGLKGASSSAQSALIVPNPSNSNQWFIFTSNVDPGTGTSFGTNYYTVNRVGATITVTFSANLLGVTASTEQLCALGDGAGGYWVITHGTDGSGVGAGAGNNTFYAYHVTSAGTVVTVPKTSNAGHFMKSYQGLMKTNSCQTQLAATYLSEATTEVYNFDNTNGVVTGVACSITGLTQPYGLEFSPNDQYLYHGTLGGTMYQLNVSTCVNTNTGWASPPNGGSRFGQLQLGPDGKIYVSNECTGSSCYIGAINTPNNVYTSAGWVNNAIVSPTPNTLGYPQLGLPTFSRTFVSGVLTLYPGAGSYCVNTGVPVSYTFSAPETSRTWSVSPATGWSFTSGNASSTNPTITFTSAGTYTVQLDVVSCSRTYTQTMVFTISNPKTPVGSIACSSPNLILSNTNSDPDAPNYIWYKNSVSSSNIIGIGSPVTYTVGNDGSMPTQICLGVAATSPAASTTVSSNKTIGSYSLAYTYSSTPYTSPSFNVLASQLVLKSIKIGFYSTAGVTNYTIAIKQGTTTVFTQTYTSPAPAASMTVPINTSLLAGTGYTIQVSCNAGVVSLYTGEWTGGTNAGEITYNASTPANGYTGAVANLNYDAYTYTASTVCSTNPCYTPGCTLPVDWVSVAATKNANNVLVDWAVGMELYNDRFEVERSLDGVNFTSVGVVKSQGNVSSYRSYSFLDSNVLVAKTLYYRVVQYDIDGKSSKSIIVVVNTKDLSDLLSVYPNPSNHDFTLEWRAEEQASYEVFDIRGSLLDAGILTHGVAQTVGESYSAGVYLIKVSTAGQASYSKVIKQ